MNIAVYCGSRPGNGDAYLQKARELGAWIGQAGHALIYGGTHVGLMGALADSALSNGAHVTGVIPDVAAIRAVRHPELSEYIDTSSVAERRTRMIELADAFVVLPGGLGTLDEITEVLSLISLDLLRGKTVFFGAQGYYRPLEGMFDSILRAGFGNAEYFRDVLFTEDIERVKRFLDPCGN